MNRKYMFDNKWTDEYERLYDEVHIDPNPPKVKIVENGVILPSKADSKLDWGLGGGTGQQFEFCN